MNSKQNTGFTDKFGNEIFDGSKTRSWRHDMMQEKNGHWLYEEVKLFNGEWCLYEVGFDHEKQGDPPSLLKNHHLEIEVIQQLTVK